MQQGTYSYTSNLKAATALATLGFKFAPGNPVTRIVRTDGKESTVFWFEAVNREGRKAAEVILGMTKGGEDLDKSDPENIVNYLRSFAANRDVLVDIIRGTPRMIEIERNGKRIAISENASEEMKRKFASKL
jgi:hypothetical protein